MINLRKLFILRSSLSMMVSPCCSFMKKINRKFVCDGVCDVVMNHSNMMVLSQTGVCCLGWSFKKSGSFKFRVSVCIWFGCWEWGCGLWCPCMRGGEIVGDQGDGGLRIRTPDMGGGVRWEFVHRIGDSDIGDDEFGVGFSGVVAALVAGWFSQNSSP